jgi:hypothetical protein
MSEPNYDEIRHRVQQRFTKRKELLMHATAFVIVNAVLWILWFAGPIQQLLQDFPDFGIPAPLIVTALWGMGFIVHFLDYYFEVGEGARRRDRAIQQEIEREKAIREDFLEKPKRDRRIQLTDEGELEEVADEDDGITAQGRRNRR